MCRRIHEAPSRRRGLLSIEDGSAGFQEIGDAKPTTLPPKSSRPGTTRRRARADRPMTARQSDVVVSSAARCIEAGDAAAARIVAAMRSLVAPKRAGALSGPFARTCGPFSLGGAGHDRSAIIVANLRRGRHRRAQRHGKPASDDDGDYERTTLNHVRSLLETIERAQSGEVEAPHHTSAPPRNRMSSTFLAAMRAPGRDGDASLPSAPGCAHSPLLARRTSRG